MTFRLFDLLQCDDVPTCRLVRTAEPGTGQRAQIRLPWRPTNSLWPQAPNNICHLKGPDHIQKGVSAHGKAVLSLTAHDPTIAGDAGGARRNAGPSRSRSGSGRVVVSAFASYVTYKMVTRADEEYLLKCLSDYTAADVLESEEITAQIVKTCEALAMPTQ